MLDRCSRCLAGWAKGSTLDTAVPLAALLIALRQRQPGPGLIHHSDRGVQYANADYRSVLTAHGLVASMSRKGNSYDNATMEEFWSNLKNEPIHRRRFATCADARTAIFDYIAGVHNRTRRHSALGYQSPLDYEFTHSQPSTSTLNACSNYSRKHNSVSLSLISKANFGQAFFASTSTDNLDGGARCLLKLEVEEAA